FGRSNTVPLNERFYLGGPDVLRGFEYRRAGGLDENGEPVGGNFRLVANMIEIRQVVYRMIGVAAFFDIGGIWQQPSAVRMRGLRYCPGAGLRVNTPIGIIRADYGINIDRKDDEPAGHIYVSVGQSF
ncbi:MAG TPA: BamA/TamA family outer membrane protein, partial [Candidatus Krumholzibacterium sp.]|nr:BamA/TamA family outer membrane protein [Candidatus Krumholzibacterium sp.]